MPIDPRTLKEVKEPAMCHLIPEGIWKRPEHVRLEGSFDHVIGSVCDEALRRAIEIHYGDNLTRCAT